MLRPVRPQFSLDDLQPELDAAAKVERRQSAVTTMYRRAVFVPFGSLNAVAVGIGEVETPQENASQDKSVRMKVRALAVAASLPGSSAAPHCSDACNSRRPRAQAGHITGGAGNARAVTRLTSPDSILPLPSQSPLRARVRTPSPSYPPTPIHTHAHTV